MIDLSVAMIGRNESAVLARALASVQNVARELIFVDTGSSDDSADVARHFGARVFEFEWQDDFAAARNASLREASSAWILVLDCDEELISDDQGLVGLVTACGTRGAQAFLVEIDNLQRDGGLLRHGALRLFRNDPRIRFNNPVHESVGESVYAAWPTQAIETAGFRLRHHGYARLDNSDKSARNERILQRWLEREPFNIYASYKYGLSLAHRRDPGAIEWLGRGFELLDRERDPQSYPFRHGLAQAFMQELRRYGLDGEAEKASARAARWP